MQSNKFPEMPLSVFREGDRVYWLFHHKDLDEALRQAMIIAWKAAFQAARRVSRRDEEIRRHSGVDYGQFD
jgi:hypothetical protein